METRARRASKQHSFFSLPQELWMIVLSFLAPKDAARAALVCAEFKKVAHPATQQAVLRLWPQHSARLAAKLDLLGVPRALSLIQAHESEAAAHPDLSKASSLQKLVLPEHRQIAVEWLIEVAWDWQLESTVVYRGAQYLDHYLAAVAVPALSRFQMLAISALRTALKHSSKLAERERARLPYKHWAEVTDGACTEAEVRSTCSKLERLLQQQQRGHPNAKQRLRYLWYRLYDAGVVKQQHVYAYMLASFLLHLSLLESSLSSVTPTLLATAALSLALEVFGFPPWPPVLQEHCLYLQKELQEVQAMLRKAQEELPAKQLRALWVHSYSYIGTNPEQQPAYTHLQMIVSGRGRLAVLQGLPQTGASSSSANSGTAARTPAAAGSGSQAQANSVAAAAAAAAAASAGPADGSVIIGVLPAAAATAAREQAGAQAITGFSAGPPVGRVTRATAGQQQRWQQQQQQQQQRLQQQQQQQPAAAANPRPHSMNTSSGVSTRFGAASLASASSSSQQQQQQQQQAANDRLLPTPQRTSLVSFSAAGGAAGSAAAAPVGASSLMAGCSDWAGSHLLHHHHPGTLLHMGAGSSSGSSAFGTAGGSNPGARRCPTRELPARRAVVSSRYGDLACRGGGAAGASPSSAAAAAAGASGSHASSSDGVGGSFAAAAAAAGGHHHHAGSSSPKHGSRGLAALFSGAGSSNSSSSAGGGRFHPSGLALGPGCRLSSEELERRSLMEGTPQPPQLPAVPHNLAPGLRRVVEAAGKGQCVAGGGGGGGGKGAGGGLAGHQSGSHMLAACQAAAAASAVAAAASGQA